MKGLDAINQKIDRLLSEGEFDQARLYMEKAAEMGSLDSQIILSNMYTFGYNTAVDEQKAFHYTLQAALQQDADMMVNLAIFYKNGTGTNVDLEESFYWFSQAAKLNNPSALYGLALSYYYGEGVRQDYTLAMEYARKAAACDSEYSLNALNLIKDLEFENALELYQSFNETEGLNQIRRLANENHIPSMLMLSGELSSKKSEELHKEAFSWALKTAQLDEPAGMYNTALYYWYGTGIEKDLHEGFIWMKNAAKANYYKAYLPLAQMYLYGIGVKENIPQAKFWIHTAQQENPYSLQADALLLEAIEKEEKRSENIYI